MTSTTKVIIFGAAGAVGRAAAIEAQARGARVFLAMRDTKKPIPGLSPELEQKGSFKRVQADLTNLDSIRNAITQSAATIAFSYVLHGNPNGMGAAFGAMKDAGIQRVVFLSSYTVYPDAKTAAARNHAISSLHGKAEIALTETGLASTIVRPMYFNSNIASEAEDVKKGEVFLLCPEAVTDYLAPEDIGYICGAKLVEQTTESEIIPICGPEILSQREAWGIVARELGHEIKINEIDEKEFLARQQAPPPMARCLADYWLDEEAASARFPADRFNEASTSITKYTGREATKFAAWIKVHKAELFGA